MFIKNDSTPEKRYFNGKIGTVVRPNGDFVTVECPGGDDTIETGYEVWDNIQYAIEEETKEIKEEIVGSFLKSRCDWLGQLPFLKARDLPLIKPL